MAVVITIVERADFQSEDWTRPSIPHYYLENRKHFFTVCLVNMDSSRVPGVSLKSVCAIYVDCSVAFIL